MRICRQRHIRVLILQGCSGISLRWHDPNQVTGLGDTAHSQPAAADSLLPIQAYHNCREDARAGSRLFTQSGADVVKLAVMPQTMQDVLDRLEETSYFHENYPDHPLITMSMGPQGCISRVAGEFFGSCVTFGAGEQASAPGQLPMEQLQEVLRILHKSVD